MNLAKVWNDNEYPFEQKYKGEIIKIPAKSYIEMDYDDAIAFKSYPYPMKKNGMGVQDPTTYKMIRVDGKPDTGNRVVAFKCHADGSLHASQEALNAYVQQNHTATLAETDENPKRKGKPIKE